MKFASHALALPCQSFCSAAYHLLGLDDRLHEVCYICHHMVFRVDTVKAMLAALGEKWPDAIDRIVPITEQWSEYDLYAAFLREHAPSDLVHRSAPWLDVPWSGDYDATLERYLARFRDARVLFVALHHHYEQGLSVGECMAFAEQVCGWLSNPDCRGRWPLHVWQRR